jgi:hypothetical protein
LRRWPAWCVGIGFTVAACDQLSRTPLQHEAYIWQRAWSPAVTQAMEQSKPFLAGWRVLLAETTAQGDWREFSPSVSTSDQQGKTITAVVRIDGQRRLGDTADLVEHLKRLIQAQPLSQWSGLEIDYDCPTSSLDAYAAFVRQVRRMMPPEMRLSVTALPTWIPSRSLRGLLDAADASVLQVHSVLDPHRGLFDAHLASNWLAEYSKLTEKPFNVALPDYGSRVGWDSSGQLVSIVSEQSVPQDVPDQREILAKVRDVDDFLANVRASHARNLVGIVWFRLPIAGDQRIWSLHTLESIVRGQPIADHRVFHVERDQVGAYQITLINDGSIDAPMPSVVRSAPCLAADGLAGYFVTHTAGDLSFVRRDASIIRAGQRVGVGWTRCAVRREDLKLEDE